MNPLFLEVDMSSVRDRRSEPRIRRLFGVAFLLEGVSVKATVTDISRSGAFLHSRALPRPGARLDFAVKVHKPGTSVVMVTGEVVRVVEESSGPGHLRGFAVRWLSMRSQAGPVAVADMLREMGSGPVPETLPMTPIPTSVEYSFEKGRFVDRIPTDPRFRISDEYFQPPEATGGEAAETSVESWPCSIPVEVFYRKDTIRATIRRIGRRYLLLRTDKAALPVSAMVTVRIVVEDPPPAHDLHILGLVVATSPDPAGGGDAEVRISSINGQECTESFDRLVARARDGTL